MASIQRLTSPLTGSTSYRVQVRLRGHPGQSETFRSRKDAERRAASTESAILEGRHFPHTRAQRTRFDALAQRYLETVIADGNASRRATAQRHIAWWLKRLGTLTLAEITPDRIAEARDVLATQSCRRGSKALYIRSGATVNRYLATLSHMFATAVTEWRLLDRNPVRDISKKKESRGRIRFLGDEERMRLLKACAVSRWPALETLVLLAVSTGARRGELIRLKWTDVTLEPPTPQAIIERTKNGDPRRLPLVGKALDSLRRLSTLNADRSLFLFPALRDPGRPYEAFDAHWYAALAASAIPDFRFHDLRHTCASYLAGQGASLLEIADVLGHRTMAMVKRYSHLAQGHKAGVIQRMTRARGL